MKILVIRIRNLASLEGTTEINFKQEPLCSAGIFAITGPTGAGKSTILDALCLALYGKTPRFRLAETGVEVKDVKGSTINQSDVRGILRDGAADGFAEVEFAGIDGSNYRATWSVRRARNRADGNLQSYEVALHNISSNVVVPGRKTELLDEIERLVGLNFDQFTRSVLLPQGDFTAFLKAGRDEKSSLLEKLTGTQVYSEISKRVFEKHRLNLQRLHELNMQKEGVSTLTKEEIEALLQRKDDLADLIIVAENKLTEIGKEIAWHEQLSDMQKNIDAASEKVEHAAAIKTASRPRVQKLQLISRVQSIKPEVDSLRSAQNNLQDKNELLGKLNDDLNQLLKQIATLEVNIRLAEKSLENNIQNNEEAQPVLDDAKSLDVRLVEISKQVGFADSEEKTAVEKYNQYRLQVEKKENEARSLDDKIRDLSKWRSANINRKPVADNESLILSKLQDGQNLLANSEANNIVIDSMTLAIGASQKLITAVGQEISSLGLSIAELTETYKRNDGLLSAIPINDVKAEENIIGMRVQDIIAADAHWKVLNAAIAEHEMLLRSLKDNRHEADSNAAQLTIVDKLQETAKIQRDTALSMLDKARLAIAENVEQLRDALVPGDPCVVCGSTSHPYAGHNPRLHQFLTELESSYKEVDKNYNDQLKTQIGLQRSIEQLRKTITTQVADLEKREKAMVGQKEQWMQFNFLFQSGDIAVHDRGEWLQNQLKSEKEKLKWLRDRIKDYEEGKANLELQKKQLDALGKKLDHQVNLAKDEERKTMSLKEQLSAKKEETQKAESDLQVIKQFISRYFPSEDWELNWKRDPGKFAGSVREFSISWKQNMQELDEAANNRNLLVESINRMHEISQSLQDDQTQKTKNKLRLQAGYKELVVKRSGIFGGEPVAKVEASLKKAIENARIQLQDHNTEITALKGKLTRFDTQKEIVAEEISVLTMKESSLKDKIGAWLLFQNRDQELPLTGTDLDSLLNFSQEWIEEEQASIREIEDYLKDASSVLRERLDTRNNHILQRRTERLPGELRALEAEAKNALQSQNTELNEINFRIRDDAANKQKIGTLLKTIAEQAVVLDNWAKLNEILGSADGKKFRQIAQEYTLDILLSYANIHLELLSKRYVLQRIPDTLGLQVQDRDMGDEVRTVYSLSGGESFLVSLALALGLASLSSNRMKVESLFIDEGFGSLDPNTLSIAMDALERLHNQGRKVGVISHVQEMTERIPVRITVNKMNNGRSTVTVTNTI